MFCNCLVGEHLPSTFPPGFEVAEQAGSIPHLHRMNQERLYSWKAESTGHILRQAR